MTWNSLRSAWKLATAALVVTGAFCEQARAVNDVLAEWIFESSPLTSSGAGTFSGTTYTLTAELGFTSNTATGVHASTSTFTGVTGNGSTKSFSSNTWAAGDYWEFTADDLGSGFSNYGLQFDQVSSTTGPRDWIVQYSTNGTTFTDFAAYTVQPNSNPAWSSGFPVAPAGLDTFDFDLRSITGLNGNPNAKIRLTAASPVVAAQQGSSPAAGGTNRIDNVSIFYNYNPTQSPVTQPVAPPVLPVTGDIVVGIDSGRQKTTLELVRGSVAPNGGSKPAPYSPWTTQNFSTFVKFDNLGGSNSHNVHGNLLALDPGSTAANGGKIYSYATHGTNPAPAPVLLANTTAALASTLGGLSVAPGNSKIAVSANNTGKVAVYNYTPDNGLGTGTPSISLVGQTSAILGSGANYPAGTQQGTAWLDDNTVLAFGGDGKLWTVDASTLATNNVKTDPITTATQSSTALAYNPNVSPYIYATYSSFVSGSPNVTTNKLFVFDPANSYNELTPTGGIDLTSTVPNNIRDIAIGTGGNLFMVTNSATGRIAYIPGATTPGSITAGSVVNWYDDEVFQSQPGFTGLDIGMAPPVTPGITGDYNNDGKVDAGDYVTWKKAQGTTNVLANDPVGGTIGTAQYNNWRANFGKPPGAGSGLDGASVPEPASIGLLLIGLAALGSRCRKG